MTPQRIFFVGTDTGIGKTTLVCALLQWARILKLRAIPFKPAQSGDSQTPTDTERLLRASGCAAHEAASACPFRYPEPLAPGLADDPTPFRRPPLLDPEPRPPILQVARERLELWEAQRNPTHVFIEGAGGLHVPMPGGTWQPQWICELAAHVVVVASSGLGTINHTLLTLDALAALRLPPLGVFFVDELARPDPSRADNAKVISAARGIPVLGTLPFLEPRDGPGPTNLLNPLLELLDA